MLGKRDESITHLVSECKRLAQKKYKQRHNNIARIVHLELCQKFGLVGEVKWYNQKPTSVVENDGIKLLWILISKQNISFSTEGLTQLCCTKLRENVTLLILLCSGIKGLS